MLLLFNHSLKMLLFWIILKLLVSIKNINAYECTPVFVKTEVGTFSRTKISTRKFYQSIQKAKTIKGQLFQYYSPYNQNYYLLLQWYTQVKGRYSTLYLPFKLSN